MDANLLERLIIKGCCTDPEYIAKLSSVFISQYFENQTASKVYDYIIKHFKEYNNIPPRSVITSEFDIDNKTDTKQLFDEIDSIDFDYIKNYDLLFNSTNEYLKEKAIKEAFLAGVDIINKKGDFSTTRKLLDEALSKDLRIDLGLDYFGSLKERLTRMMGPGDMRVPTGFPILDEYMSGGMPPYTLSVMVARIHGFKCLSGNTEIVINDNGLIKYLPIKDFFINTYNHAFKEGISMIKNNRMDMFIKKYGEIEGTKRYDQWVIRQKNSHMGKSNCSLQSFINRYGEEKGKEQYNEYINKLKLKNKNINTLEYYKKKYGNDLGQIKYEEKNKKVGDKGRGTLPYFINRYGEDEGQLIYNQYIERQKHSNSEIGYIEKYGELEGKDKWKKRCERSAKCRTLDGFISKYGEKEGIIRWQQKQIRWMKSYKKTNFSKVSQKLFWLLYDEIKDKYKEIFFAEIHNNMEDKSGSNNEYILKLDKSYCKLDFFIKDINKCIEFDGDYWHGKKRGNQKKDLERTELIEDTGIKVFRVQEREFNKNPENVTIKCLEFING